MRISCPSCKENFKVDEGSIGKNGRKVKCSECGFSWFQESFSADISKTLRLPKKEVFIREEKPSAPRKGGLLLPFFLFVLFGGFYFIFLDYNSGIKLASVSFYYEGDNLSVEYSMENESPEEAKIPLVYLDFEDAGQAKVKSYLLDSGRIFMKAGSSANFKTTFPSPSPDILSVKAYTGNWFDFIKNK